MSERFTATNKQMRSRDNLFRHGVYLLLYGLVKNCAVPFSEWLRYLCLKPFARELKSTSIAEGVHIWFPWNVSIGANSSLNQGVIIDGFGGVEIGSGVRIAAYAVINTADHGFEDAAVPIHRQGFVCAPVRIGDDVWIGTHVCIGKGVEIGEGAVIGAGSVVTKDVPPFSVAVGNPARVIRRRGLDGSASD